MRVSDPAKTGPPSCRWDGKRRGHIPDVQLDGLRVQSAPLRAHRWSKLVDMAVIIGDTEPAFLSPPASLPGRTNLSRSVTAALLVILLHAAPATAGLIRVDHTGGGDFLTISEGIAAAVTGDTVLVARGTYTGPLNRGTGVGGGARS